MSKITHGFTEPRIFTRPLRELTPETSRGFEIISFAENVLGVTLFPWQKWLFVHLGEINPDGTLRFRKALIVCARQQGKSLLAAVLAAFFLYVDSVRWPELVQPRDFVVVGAAQKLDIAMKPWTQVRRWGGPDDPRIGIAHDRVPLLRRARGCRARRTVRRNWLPMRARCTGPERSTGPAGTRRPG